MLASDLIGWIREFFAVQGPINFWSIINSTFFTTAVLGAATAYFAHLGNRLSQRVEDEETIRSLQEGLAQDEVHAQEPAAPAGEDHFREAAQVIENLKRLVDAKVEDISDGRSRRKYETIGKRDYRLRVAALEYDGEVGEERAGLLTHAFELWRPYQTNRRPTPRDVLGRLRQLEGEIMRN